MLCEQEKSVIPAVLLIICPPVTSFKNLTLGRTVTSGTILPYSIPPPVLTNSEGAMVAQFFYGPWGEITRLYPASFTPDFCFAGMYFHERSEMNLTWLRAYSPSLGRWLSREPLEVDGTTDYIYAFDNPINFIDPFGDRPINSKDFNKWKSEAVRIINRINATSVSADREYAGLIITPTKGGPVGHTGPFQGGQHCSDPRTKEPRGYDYNAEYHTHGANSPGYDEFKYSPKDQFRAEEFGYPSFLGSYNGRIQVYVPNSAVIQLGDPLNGYRGQAFTIQQGK
jgi:RHS repeat-associated protein